MVRFSSQKDLHSSQPLGGALIMFSKCALRLRGFAGCFYIVITEESLRRDKMFFYGYVEARETVFHLKEQYKHCGDMYLVLLKESRTKLKG